LRLLGLLRLLRLFHPPHGGASEEFFNFVGHGGASPMQNAECKREERKLRCRNYAGWVGETPVVAIARRISVSAWMFRSLL
jgi:hypothetical protein